MNTYTKRILALLLFAFTPCCAFFQIGYGAQSKGIGGCAIATPQDSLVVAVNPAGLIDVGRRVDFGGNWWQLLGSAQITEAIEGKTDRFHSDNSFTYPDLGVSLLCCRNVALGVALTLAGAFDASFGTPVPVEGTTNLAGRFRQYWILPTVAVRLNETHTLGGTVVAAFGRANFSGLEALIPLSDHPNDVTDRGWQTAWGLGFKFGWLATFFERLKAGAAIASPVWAHRLTNYQGLIADGGNLNTPASAAVGVAVLPTPYLTLTCDLIWRFWSFVPGWGNPAGAEAPFGSTNGPGFGWEDRITAKLGLMYAWTDCWTGRIGYAYTETPIRGSDVRRNLITLDTTEHFLTLGLSWRRGRSTTSFSFIHSFPGRVDGALHCNREGACAVQGSQNQISLTGSLCF